MHVSIRTYPVRYEPGTYLSSGTVHTVEGNEYVSKFQTGANVRLPNEQLHRTIATELTAGGIYVERAFLQTEHGSEMFPIWSKFYNKESAPTVIYKESITTLVNEWGDEKFSSSRFLGEEMLGKTLYELSAMYSLEAEAMWDEVCICSGIAGSLMNNNYPIPVGLILDHKSENPYWSGAYLSAAMKDFYRRQTRTSFNDASSLSILCGPYFPYETNFFKEELRKRSEPDLGDEYFNQYCGVYGVNYDNLTEKSYLSPEMGVRKVRKYLGLYRPDKYVKLDNFLKAEDAEVVTSYHPGLQSFLSVLHDIPAFEYWFVFKAPMNDGEMQQLSSLEWITCVQPSMSARINNEDIISKLESVLNVWCQDIYEIHVAKNADSEVLLAIRSLRDGDHLFYLDLTIAALLSSNMTYKQ